MELLEQQTHVRERQNSRTLNLKVQFPNDELLSNIKVNIKVKTTQIHSEHKNKHFTFIVETKINRTLYFKAGYH